MSYRNNKYGGQPYLSQNNFNDWLKDPDLVRVWHHERDKMPKPTPEVQKLLDFGHVMHAKAHELYPDGFEETRNLSYPEHLENSMKLILERRIPLFELGFQFDNIYARPDIMVPVEKDTWDMIEVKAAPGVHEDCEAGRIHVLCHSKMRHQNQQVLFDASEKRIVCPPGNASNRHL